MDVRKLIIVALVIIGLFFVLYLALDWGGTENPIINNNGTETPAPDKTNEVAINYNLNEYKAIRDELIFKDNFCIDTTKIKDYEFSSSNNTDNMNANFRLYNSGTEVSSDEFASISVEHIKNFNSIKLDQTNEKYIDNINEKYYYGTIANSDTYVYGYVLDKNYICITITQLYYKDLDKEKADKMIETIKAAVSTKEDTVIFDKVFDTKTFDSYMLSKENCTIDCLNSEGYIVSVDEYDVDISFSKDPSFSDFKQVETKDIDGMHFGMYTEEEDSKTLFTVNNDKNTVYYSVLDETQNIDDFYKIFTLIYTK